MKASEELQKDLQQFQGGDTEVFERIYKNTYSYLHMYVINFVKNEDIAQDILQEIYIEIVKHKDQLENPEKFYSWAWKIAHNKCCTSLKKEGRERLLNEEEEQANILENVADDEEFIPESFMQDQEKQRLIREIIDGLTDNQRLCVIAFYYYQLSQEEIADELGIPVNTVKSHLNRAKIKIKEEVIKLDKEKGTRLYTFAPFLLLLFGIEAEACETSGIPEMSDRLVQEVELLNRSETQINKQEDVDNSGKVKGIEKAAKGTVKTKLYISIGAIIAAAVIVAIIFVNVFNSGRQGSETDNSSAEYEEMQSGDESEETANIIDESESEQEEEIAQEEPEQEYEMQELFVLDTVYEGYGNAYGGIIPVKADGRWGAIDYNNNIVVPCEYNDFYSADNSGNIVFIKTIIEYEEYEYFLFDHQGNLIYQGEDQVRASGGMYIILHQYYDDDFKYYVDVEYHRMDGTLVYSQENVNVYDAWINTFYDGISVINDFTGPEDSRIVTIDTQGNVSYRDDPGNLEWEADENTSSNEEYNDSGIFSSGGGSDTFLPRPIRSAMNHGYYIVGSRNVEVNWIEVYDENDNYVASFYFSLLYVDGNGNAGIADEFDDDYEIYNKYYGFYVDGGYLYNYGPHMVFGADGKYILVDFSKNTGDVDITDSDNIITAVYDYISMADEKYWLVQSGDRWGYIDHDGNEAALFDDAASFANGFALVIEDGEAWLINEELEKVENLGSADSVSTMGDLYMIIVGGENHIYQINYKN